MLKRFFFYSIAIALSSACIWYLYESESGDFRESNIIFDLPLRMESNTPKVLSPGIKKLLDQKFTWIGHGHQVYAFGSADGKYVLKIFKIHKLKPSWIETSLAYVPFSDSHRNYRIEKRLRREERLFKGYNVAYEYDKDLTGLIYVHLNAQNNKQLFVVLQDRFGFSHRINLEETIFAIQERAKKTKDVLKELLDNGKVELVKIHINQLLKMYLAEYQRGILDRDHNVVHNTGFVGMRPIRLDVGRLTLDDEIKNPEAYQKDLDNIIHKRILPWINKNYPQHYVSIKESVLTIDRL
jgi:hypothetical protein